VRIAPRRAFVGLIIAGAAGGILLLPAIYLFGSLVGPPRPVADGGPLPPLIAGAIWARAGGGRAEQLRPINHIALAHLVACVVTAPGENDNERIGQCRHVIPALRGLEYLSALHVEDNGVSRRSFRGGHGAAATTVWMTRSWSRDEFVRTLAARGNFGFDWRGVTVASRRYFDREPEALTLAQAALLASRLGDAQPDPWCEPAAAAAQRNRVLGDMRDNGAIDDAAFDAASIAPLELARPPEGRPPCRD
jgi:hypothetical protein